MEDKLDKILEEIKEIKNSNGYVILIFFCFMSTCTTCCYVKQMAQEQQKTNRYLRIDYYENNQDTSTIAPPSLGTKKYKNKQ